MVGVMPNLLVLLPYMTATVATICCFEAAASAGPITRIPGMKGDSAGLLLIASRDRTAAHARMRRCMQGWGPATQMSRREWKSTCERVIKQQPGLFGPDPL
jgi:hypothetical protein